MRHRFKHHGVFALLGLVLVIAGCGTYRSQLRLLPQEGNGWAEAEQDSLDVVFRCGTTSLRVGPVIAQSRDVAQAFLWLPIPGTGDKNDEQNLFKHLARLEITFGSSRISSCRATRSLVYIRSPKIDGEEYPSDVTGESSQETYYCRYTFASIGKIGDEFTLYISPNLLNCVVKPLHFKRTDTTSYSPLQVHF